MDCGWWKKRYEFRDWVKKKLFLKNVTIKMQDSVPTNNYKQNMNSFTKKKINYWAASICSKRQMWYNLSNCANFNIVNDLQKKKKPEIKFLEIKRKNPFKIITSNRNINVWRIVETIKYIFKRGFFFFLFSLYVYVYTYINTSKCNLRLA